MTDLRTVLFAAAVAWAMPALSDVVVENDAFKLVVGDDARAQFRRPCETDTKQGYCSHEYNG